MSSDKNTLKIVVDEQRRLHDELTNSYRSLRLKIISFIGASLALLAFLYSDAIVKASDTVKLTTEQRLFIPNELYGTIFYFIGLGCIIFALGKLVHGARPGGRWSFPFEVDDYATAEQYDEEEYLKRLRNEYVKSTNSNLAEHSKKNEAIRDSFYPLLLGAIIMVVLKYFQ